MRFRIDGAGEVAGDELPSVLRGCYRCGTGLRIEAGDTVLLRCSSKRCKAGWEVRSSGRIVGLRERAGDVTRRFYAAAFGVHGRGPASKLVGAAA